ncbi:gamma-glutamyl peptidase 3-like [Wolffia australiana]
MAAGRRFAVLRTGHATEYTERVHGGYGRMLARLLEDDDEERGGGESETWDVFSVIDGDFSFLHREAGDDYDGYVVTGSAADAHATDVDWINRLLGALLLLHSRKKKLLGICFGHQILARALGGKTGRAEVGWELGVKTLQVDSETVSRLYGLAIPSTIRAIESHQDQVLMLPPQAVLLASSEKTKIEMFAIGDDVLCMQCHPEFTEDVIEDLVRTRLSRNLVSDDLAKEALASFGAGPADQATLKQLCKAFLKNV